MLLLLGRAWDSVLGGARLLNGSSSKVGKASIP
uniref:Uncharacterized protein n=1 Tax=Arundo donax TaxID=35708 RepID=A0A0A9AV09_ARUDO